MAKTRVAVLRGGISDEYDVSLKTGECMLHALSHSDFHPLDVVISKEGEWLLHGRARSPHEILHTVDVVLNGLHGKFGEDGTVQRILERHGVPYTGSDAYASALAMNKAITKDRLRATGILLPRHLVVIKSALENTTSIARRIASHFGPRFVVKPVSGGSSIGTCVANNELELAHALFKTLTDYEEVLVEEHITGREATCGVIEHFRDESLYALPVVEIVPPESAGFFSAEVKYNGETKELCPARFTIEEKRNIEQMAKQVHEALGLSHYSRSDFIVADKGIYFLEVNTLPGMTTESLFPKALAAVGVPYKEFIRHLLTVAGERKAVAVR